MTPRRTAFPVMVGGLAAATLSAVATAKPLARATDVPGDLPLAAAPPADLPLAGALSLVVLAAWGVALVTRRRVRRGVLALGLLAAVGVVATLAVGAGSLADDVRDTYAGTGVRVEAALTGWYAAAVVGAGLSVVALALAVRLCPAWPEMGTRYDAPAPAARPADDDARALDAWRALDEGRDPTDPR